MGANEYVFTDKEERVVNDISLSLMLKWYVLNKRLAIDLGVQPNFVCNVRSVELSSFGIDSLNVNIQHEVISDTTYLMKKDVEYLPFTLSVIGGMTYYFNDMFLMSVRYSFGLTDLFVKEVGYLDALLESIELARLFSRGHNSLIEGFNEERNEDQVRRLEGLELVHYVLETG